MKKEIFENVMKKWNVNRKIDAFLVYPITCPNVIEYPSSMLSRLWSSSGEPRLEGFTKLCLAAFATHVYSAKNNEGIRGARRRKGQGKGGALYGNVSGLTTTQRGQAIDISWCRGSMRNRWRHDRSLGHPRPLIPASTIICLVEELIARLIFQFISWSVRHFPIIVTYCCSALKWS